VAVFAFAAGTTKHRTAPRSSLCTSAHCNASNSPRRQPVESAATITARSHGSARASSAACVAASSRRERGASARRSSVTTVTGPRWNGVSVR
jgi:hypothetical protein